MAPEPYEVELRVRLLRRVERLVALLDRVSGGGGGFSGGGPSGPRPAAGTGQTAVFSPVGGCAGAGAPSQHGYTGTPQAAHWA